MLRKVTLILIAIGMSFALTALSAYLLYANSEGRSEATLSLLVRFVISPTIAALVGTFVGFFSRNHPVPMTILGLAPWTTVLLFVSSKPISLGLWTGWLVTILVYLAVSSAAAWLVWRSRRKVSDSAGLLG
jgi:hypothetical protein